ncbi:expressed unknown protein [Seminavis robusta]|uniref:Uncharacterized protein n=1 Tax=Seminavis robusta TaxID=568900 RepID=A0A9N8D8E6_9STRA|nr:expressed unknown protein [Seminavis robusta]|eukprot:Sro30_g019520.1 n/a (2734) ;mRNA; f:49845-58278
MLSRHRRKKNKDRSHAESHAPPEESASSVPVQVPLLSPIAYSPIASINAHGDPLALYAAPTVDTLDDESLFLGRTYQRRHLSDEFDEGGVTRHHVSFTPLSVDASTSMQDRQYSYRHTAHSPTKRKEKLQNVQEEDDERMLSSSSKTSRSRQPHFRGDFQHKDEAMTVAIVPVNVDQRSAFELCKPVSIEEWHRAAQQLESQQKNSNSKAHKKLSPSLQHLKLLHYMQSVHSIRQLAFSPSVGIDSDIFVPWWKEALPQKEETTTGENNNTNKQLKRRTSSLADLQQRDGRYRSIHPVHATVSALPTVPPALSNRKTRIPMRSDVGFPGASEDEIKIKTAEINHETEWEQASPRIIVLVTSDDLGTAVVQEDWSGHNKISPEHEQWNSGGLEGMPWAGRDLLRAKEMNALHFSKKTSILLAADSTHDCTTTATSTTASTTTTSSHTMRGVSRSEDKKKRKMTKKRLLEPNRTSVLAPPLDASYSKTLGWRPRPFSDRAAGMEYLLSWPLNVSFHIGDVEPLLCSLALYNLPINNHQEDLNGTGRAYGKISEEFFFPAGNWDGKVELDPSYLQFPNSATADTTATATEKDLMQSWSDKKHKAIFSYDPLVICGDNTCLFWVLQVFKVANEESTLAYLHHSKSNGGANENYHHSNRRTNGVTRLFKSKSNSSSKTMRSGTPTDADQESAGSFFDKFGTKFMSPLAFGVTSVLQNKAAPDDDEEEGKCAMDFPKGRGHDMELVAAPSVPESQEDFVQRLSRLTMAGSGGEKWSPSSSLGGRSAQKQPETVEALELASVASSVSDRSGHVDFSHQMKNCLNMDKSGSNDSKRRAASPATRRKKKHITKRIWMSPVKATRSIASSSFSSPNKTSKATRADSHEGGNDGALKICETPLVGTTRIFTSVLTADWLQAMLKEPTDASGVKLSRQPSPTQTNSSNLPRLLCDVSGDFAVMLEAKGASSKRSSLSRLPCHTKPAGYSASSEIREVLFLPVRAEKTYDVDIPHSFRSLMNLLYLYPKLLRYSPDQPQQNGSKAKKHQRRKKYSIRTRLVRTSMDVDQNGKISSSTTALGAFHSPTPWTGPALLEEVYTKLPVFRQHKNESQTNGKTEQAMKDELKLRLPQIMDGSYFLQFTLFEIEAEEKNEKHELCARPVAENSIPLSTTTVSDSAGGQKVATVIPNGCHRIRLGDFKFYIESRLISSIHIGDPAVAAAVRDFPASSTQDAQGEGQKLQDTSTVTFPSSSFANASDGTLVGHFHLLLYVHLSNLLRIDPTQQLFAASDRVEFVHSILFSLFEVLNKVKARLDGTRLAAMIKKVADDFEEDYLTLSDSESSGYKATEEQATDAGSESNDLKELHTESAAEESGVMEFEDDEDDPLDEGAVRWKQKDSLKTGIERRLTRRASIGADVSSSASIFRVAYGASKTDRLKIEAELYYSGGGRRFSHLFDDDETIVTAGTKQHLASVRGQNGSKLFTIDHSKSFSDELLHAEKGINASSAAATPAAGAQASKATGDFANRVKTVANVMLAPCGVEVGKTTSPRRISLDCGRASRRRRSAGKAMKSTEKSGEPSDELGHNRDTFVFPGSDNEEDDDFDPSRRKKSRYFKFRGFGLHAQKPWTFCASHRGDQLGAGYIYESLLLLWIQAWEDHKRDEGSKRALLGFCQHLDLLLPLCLKSVCLRLEDSPDRARAILDEKHLVALEQFSMVLAKSIMLAYSENFDRDNQDATLSRALAASEGILDFFAGLFAVLHPEHMRCILESYFRALGECENEHIRENRDGLLEFDWTEHGIHRIRLSRQLRLRAVEKFAVLPSFLALNFPLRYSSDNQFFTPGIRDNEGDSTWKVQYSDRDAPPKSRQTQEYPYVSSSEDGKLPQSGWLAFLLANEALSVCALSCEAVVAEAIAHIGHAQNNANNKGGEGETQRKLQLERGDLLMFQSLAIHAITATYELLLRRHAMDLRFQTNSSRGRIAALYTECLFTQSLQSVRWLARMESTHKVRSVWMLCVVYSLQETPEALIRSLVRSYCDPSDILIHRFIRLLRLASSTLQAFVDQPRHSTYPAEIDEAISPWLLQESFNTICAATNLVVEECVKLTESNPKEQRKMIHSILDLFLHILTTPQSAVTHLRALGGALQALDQFGIKMFLSVVDDNLQHWVRVILGLMNSTSLSVRSISVDFVLSLLGSAFDMSGNIDSILLVFAAVLPEVAAREIGLFSVDGLVSTFEDIERSLWGLRRSFQDLEDANPLDDDRIDPELLPVLKPFCRAMQAILDSVLIELRLRDKKCTIVGTRINFSSSKESLAFDADEESVWEAASYFVAETAPLQRIRWLLTLKALHESKGQWLEAAETMIACANTISDAIPHLDEVWRPSRFLLWSDSRRSTWLSTVGEDMGHPDRGNAAVVAFSDEFLEPASILGVSDPRTKSTKLRQPTLPAMCTMLTTAGKEAVKFFLMEDGVDQIAYARLEKLLTTVVNVLGEHGTLDSLYESRTMMTPEARKRHVEEVAALRRVSISLSADMTQLAERLLLVIQDEPTRNHNNNGGKVRESMTVRHSQAIKRPFYVLVTMSGAKPPRFQESTTLPTFIEWNTPCVIRVQQQLVNAARRACKDDFEKLSKHLCAVVGKSLQQAIAKPHPVDLRVGADHDHGTNGISDVGKTYIDVVFLHTDVESVGLPLDATGPGVRESKRFFYTKSDPLVSLPEKSETERATTLVEVTVAHTFPSVLSRQRALLTSLILPDGW